MKKNIVAALLHLICTVPATSFGQNVGIGTLTPDSSAKLDIHSTAQGFLPPRMTFAQRNTIVNPAQGLMVFCLDCDTCGQMQVYSGARWCTMTGAAAAAPSGATCLYGVRICSQVWSTRNLDVVTYRNGDTIPQVTDPASWGTLTTGAWCWYDNDPTNGKEYGRLYNWHAVNDPRGLAPIGWRIPTDHDWNVLIKCIDEAADTTCSLCVQSPIAGGAMKEVGFLHWMAPNTGATNSSGFTALPAGFVSNFSLNGFSNLQFLAGFWSANAIDNTFVGIRSIDFNRGDIFRRAQFKTTGLSVRLIKD
jgi:uncharacterized protein (TIGR02145 family)